MFKAENTIHIVQATREYFAVGASGYFSMVRDILNECTSWHDPRDNAIYFEECIAYYGALGNTTLFEEVVFSFPVNGAFLRKIFSWVESRLISTDEVTIVIHQPVPLSLELVQQLKSRGYKIVNIWHDVSPFVLHNGVWQGQSYNTTTMLSELAFILSKDDVDQFFIWCSKWAVTAKYLDPINTGLEIYKKNLTFQEYKIFIEHKLESLYKLIKSQIEQANASDLNVVPSKFTANQLKQIGIHKNVQQISNPSKVSDSIFAIPTKDLGKAEIHSVYAWWKFDVWHYMSLALTMPYDNFVLWCDDNNLKMLKTLDGHILPDNIELRLIKPKREWLSLLKENPPVAMLHYCLAAESYGILVDEMEQLGIPTLCLTVDNAIQQRYAGRLEENEIGLINVISARKNEVIFDKIDISTVRSALLEIMDCQRRGRDFKALISDSTNFLSTENYVKELGSLIDNL